MRLSARRSIQLIGVASCGLVPGTVLAQSRPAAAAPAQTTDRGGVPEIIVTAQKRAQSLKDVGLTVVAASDAQLQKLGVTDIGSLTKAVSGLSVATSYDGLPIFAIRGIGFNTNQYGASPTVSVYVDEAPLPYLAMTEGTTLDIERVEVLKGPQGTLFGNNSTGGSINFIAAKPTDTMSAGLRSSIDRFGQVFLEGFASGPVTDTLKVRVAANTTQGGDWQHSYTPGPRLKNGAADKGAERVILDWAPSSKLKISLNLNHFYDYSDVQMVQFVAARSTAGPGTGYVDPVYGSIETYPLPPHNDRAADFTAGKSGAYGFDNEQYQAALRADYHLDDQLTLTSISNYAHGTYGVIRPLDGTRIDIIDGGHTGRITTYGEELRLTGDFRDIGLNVIAGGNASKDKVEEHQPYQFNHFSALPPGFEFNPNWNFTSRTLAAFANADWEVAKHVTLTGGVRYTSVRQTFDGCNPDLGGGVQSAFITGIANAYRAINSGLGPTDAYVPGGCVTIGPAPDYLPFRFQDVSTENNVSWRAGVNYKPSRDMLIYGLVSRGYKAGAYPLNIALVSSQYKHVKQEELTAYEAGVKLSAGRAVSFNAAVYYYDYKNKQSRALFPVPLIGAADQLTNIPKSKAYGAEAELTLVPVSGLTLHGAVTYTKTKITDPGTLTLDGFGAPIDLHGEPFSYAPKWTGVFDGEYRVPVGGDLTAFVGMNGVYNSATYGTLDFIPEVRIKPYTVLDARVGLESRKGWTAFAWVRNLTDKYYWTSATFAGDGFERTTGMPRNFGLTLQYRY